MTDSFPNVSLPDEAGTSQTEQGGKVDAAREQASDIKDHAMDAGGHLAETSKERASDVVGEAKSQAKDLLGQTRDELRDQAEQQQRRVAEGLRSISDEFSQMAQNSENGGMASELVQNAAQRTGSIAGWLDDRDPGSLLSEARRFASRKPGTFIAVAAVAGLLAGRLTRSIASSASDQSGDSASSGGGSMNTGSSTGSANSGAGAAYGSTGQYGGAAGGSAVTPDTAGTGATSTPVYSALGGDEVAGDEYSDEYVEGAGEPERIEPLGEAPAGTAEHPFGEER